MAGILDKSDIADAIELLSDQDENGRTLLHIMAAEAESNTDFIVDMFAKLDEEHRVVLLEIIDNQGLTPLHTAALYNSDKIVRVLLTPFIFEVQSLIKLLTIKNPQGFTPVHLAVLNRNSDVIKSLCDGLTGMDRLHVIGISSEGLPPFHMAIFFNSSWKSHSSAVKDGENGQINICQSDDDIREKLCAPSSIEQRNDLITSLVSNLSAERIYDLLCIEDNKNRTPLHIACLINVVPVMNIVLANLSYDQKLNLCKKRQEKSCTLMHLAIQSTERVVLWEQLTISTKNTQALDKVEMLELLLDQFEQDDKYELLCIVNNKGETPLHQIHHFKEATDRDELAVGILKLLSIFTSDQILELLLRKDKENTTVAYIIMDMAIFYNHETLLRHILNLLAPDQLVQFLAPTGRQDKLIPMHLAALNASLEILGMFSDRLNTEQCMHVLSCLEKPDDTSTMHVILGRGDQKVLDIFFKRLATKEKVMMLQLQTKSGVKPLHKAAEGGHIEIIKHILSNKEPGFLIPCTLTMKCKTTHLDARFSKSLADLTVMKDGYLKNAIQNWITNSEITSISQRNHLLTRSGLDHILQYLCNEMKFRDHLLLWSDCHGNTLLHYAAMISHQKFIEKVLRTQIQKEINDTLIWKNISGSTPYHLTDDDDIRNQLAWAEKQAGSYHLHTPPSTMIFCMEEGRLGADQELQCLADGLRALGMDPVITCDPTEREVFDGIRQSQRPDMSAMIVAILSHGDSGVVILKDKPMKISDILKQMNSNQLHHIPKVLILQACQSSQRPNHQTIPPRSHGASQDAAPNMKVMEANQEERKKNEAQKVSTKPEATQKKYFDVSGPDMLVISSTINHATSTRNLMIPELVSCLKNPGIEDDLLHIATKTTQRVREITEDTQIPEVRSTLEYKLRLSQVFKPAERYKSDVKQDIKSRFKSALFRLI